MEKGDDKMSYSILRNEKHKRSNASKSYMHNERKNKNYSNKNIDLERTYLNYHIKQPLGRYEKEFDRLKQENDLEGQIKETSVIMCELLMTSDKSFFNSLDENETKRFFQECFNFVAKYKNLGKENIISAVVHMDEETPHMHLSFIPVVDSKDKSGNSIRKVCSSDYWKGKNSYGQMQDAFNQYLNEKGFKLERGETSERKHLSVEEFKQVTNFENTQKTLKDITLELPEVPDIKDIKNKFFNRDEQIQKEIIEPKDKLIEKLYAENKQLHKELSRQTNLVNFVQKYHNENSNLRFQIFQLKSKCKDIEIDYKTKIKILTINFDKKFNSLSKKYNRLEKAMEHWVNAFEMFVIWICKKFDLPGSDYLIREFEKEHKVSLDFRKQLNNLNNNKDRQN